MTGPALLALDDVKVWFGGVKAVDGVSLELAAGCLHGLVGPNGSGKTTLVNAMSRLAPLTAGRVRLGGEDVSRWTPHRVYRAGLARTFQGIRLLPELSVRENVALGADEKERGRSGKSADDALRRLDLAPFAHLRPGALPYGTQRRVEIARALAGAPQLLLLDEPVAGMNSAERGEIAEVLRQLRRDGLAMLLIEHDLQFVLDLSDDLFVLNFGRLIAAGDPKEVAADERVREAYLGKKHVAP